jgi:hypothetical protein
MGNLYRILVGKPEGQRSLGRRRYRWEDNIKMDFEGLGLGVELIHLAQKRDYSVADSCEPGDEICSIEPYNYVL